ncbi:NADP-dependent oxidoreductase domain-containing protein [Zopfochytrium polystomum]|nr:NADP-dependent oxidoreductase domain-containing protein [Zopfochytrium polystomum]
MAFAFPPAPKSPLGYHRILSSKAGVKVSPLCLGTMNFGESWEGMLGKCSKDTAFEILDYFFQNGGNFIDTSNNYQGGESEQWLGEWLESRKNRDQIVLATKYSTLVPNNGEPEVVKINFNGNNAKSLRLSVESSLKKLKTDYIDLLYLHWWDFSTSIEEIMQSLHRLVLAGKVLYLGVGETPAWIVSSANRYARDHGLTEFSVYQGRWSAADRHFERDVLPMAAAEGLAVVPWGVFGQNLFKSAAELVEDDAARAAALSFTDAQRAVAQAVESVAARKGTVGTSVALAYVMHKAPYVFPIVAVRKLERLKDGIAALSLELTPEDIDEIENATPFDIGFPFTMLFEFHGYQKYRTGMTTSDIPLVKFAGHVDTVTPLQPIKPRKV